MLFLIIVFSFFFYAKWETHYHDGDELKGYRGYGSYCWRNETGAIVFYDSDDVIVKIMTSSKLRQFKATKGLTELITNEFTFDDYCKATVGIYKNEKLIKKGWMIIKINDKEGRNIGYFEDANDVNFDFLSIPWGEKIKKIDLYNALCKDGTSVRIIIETFGKDIDIRFSAEPELFKKISWIPAVKTEKAVEKRAEALRKIEEDEKRQEEIRKQEKIEKELTVKAKIDKLEKDYASLNEKHKKLLSKGYTFSAKRLESELNRILQELSKLR